MNKEDLNEYKEKLASLTEEEQKQRDIYLKGLADGTIQGPGVGYASIDKPWLKYYDDMAIKGDVSKKSPYELMKETCIKLKNKICLTYMPNDKIKVDISFTQLQDQNELCAKSLAQLNKTKDDMILTLLPNTPESKELMYGSFKTGVQFYPVFPLIPANTLDNILKTNDNVDTIFIFEGFYEKYKDVLSKYDYKIKNIVVVDAMESLNDALKTIARLRKPKSEIYKNPKAISYENFLKLGKKYKGDIDKYYEYDENDTRIIIGTSGTTGIPKGVCLTGKNINTIIYEHLNGDFNFNEGDKYLDIMNNSIAYGAITSIYTMVGGLRTYFKPTLVSDVYPILKKYGINQMAGGPIHVSSLGEHFDNGEEMPKVKNWVSGGATLDKNLINKINKIPSGAEVGTKLENEGDVIIRQGYGASENFGVISYQKEGTYKVGGIGIPLIKEKVGIFKPGTSQELGIGEEGEICIYAPSVMKEYLNNNSETDKVLKKHEDGLTWLHTQDLGKIDQDGQLYIVDRIKNIFGRRGFNVHPGKITEFLKTLEGVKDCVVTGIDHPHEQCVPVAFIELDDNIKNTDEFVNFLKNECYKELEESSIPYDFFFVSNIPVNGGGKPDVNYLKEMCGINYFENPNSQSVNEVIKVNTMKL